MVTFLKQMNNVSTTVPYCFRYTPKIYSLCEFPISNIINQTPCPFLVSVTMTKSNLGRKGLILASIMKEVKAGPQERYFAHR